MTSRLFNIIFENRDYNEIASSTDERLAQTSADEGFGSHPERASVSYLCLLAAIKIVARFTNYEMY